MRVILLSLLLAAQAHAQTPDEVAERAFAEADDERALALFRRAFELAPHDAVRFNIAVCLERLGRPAEAISEYEAAARSAQLDEATRARARDQADAVRARVAASDVRAREDRARAADVRARGTPIDAVTIAPAQPSRDEGLAPGWATWTGVALVAIGGAGIVGFSLRTSDLERAYVAQPTVATRDEGLLTSGLAYASIGLASLGALLVIADLVWLRSGASGEPDVAVSITGAGIALRGRF